MYFLNVCRNCSHNFCLFYQKSSSLTILPFHRRGSCRPRIPPSSPLPWLRGGGSPTSGATRWSISTRDRRFTIKNVLQTVVPSHRESLLPVQETCGAECELGPLEKRSHQRARGAVLPACPAYRQAGGRQAQESADTVFLTQVQR